MRNNSDRNEDSGKSRKINHELIRFCSIGAAAVILPTFFDFLAARDPHSVQMRENARIKTAIADCTKQLGNGNKSVEIHILSDCVSKNVGKVIDLRNPKYIHVIK